MTDEKRKIAVENGKLGGRPKGSGGSISRLRSTLNKIKELEEDAINLIADKIHGKKVDKDQVENAWKVINSLISLTRGAIAEEQFRDNKREKREEKQAEAVQMEGTNNRPIKFQTTIIKPSYDDEYDDED